ncbi:TPA: Ltp family lipoprotein [Listeria monocytogenes]|nr:Ltp family lipoprotein [Listeria monocytogenes]EJN2365826.1 Ltp family lipoprotein [Listeria monocytogenes]HDZ6879251.1 Ltp family lipoprotein [Listeria monocytogenes]
MTVMSVLLFILGFLGLLTGFILIIIKHTRKAGLITIISSVAVGIISVVFFAGAVIQDEAKSNKETNKSAETDSSVDFYDDYSSSDESDNSNSNDEDYSNSEENAEDKTTESDENNVAEKNVPPEYTNALKQAENYSNQLYLSKKGILQQLKSKNADNFSDQAALYAIDNLVADYKFNAMQMAKIYQKDMNMSKEEIREQLSSENGEQFTQEEADFAVKYLK